MKNLIKRLLGRHKNDPFEGDGYAKQLKAQGMMMGAYCSISPRAVITDPAYTRIGHNVRISDAHLVGHDGSINMINRMAGTAYDAVGPIVIGDHVFIGHGVTVLHGTSIGSHTIIGAGATVKGNIEGGFVYGGNPLVKIRTMADHLEILKGRHNALPKVWRSLIEQRGTTFDPVIEPDLVRERTKHFFKTA